MKRLLTIATVVVGLSIGFAEDATAQTTVKTILNNGNSTNRYDIVILGDGYQTTEQAKFDSNAQAVINHIMSIEPYKTFEPFFNVHTVFRASKDSGADHPDRSPPIVKDTVYDASYNTGGTPRCLYIKNTSQALSDAALAPAMEGRVMVIVNDSRYGGCAGTFAVTYNGTSMTTVQAHEFGHSFARVADEYDYPNQTYTGGEPSQKNVTKDSTGQTKWPKWLGYNGVSAFEGAKYYRYGLYRPKSNCLMRSLSSPLCPVCQEQVVLYGYKTVSAIDKPVPSTTTVAVNQGAKPVFSFTSLAPASSNAKITWKVDGIVQSSTTTSATVDTSSLTFGNHTVLAEVLDRTAYVRNDPSQDLRSTRAWTLAINTPQLPDLTPTFLIPQPTTIAAGSTLVIQTWIKNIGPAGSPAVQVEHFLSLDKTLTTADTYLGSYNAAALIPNDTRLDVRNGVKLPAHVLPGTYNMAVVIDRTDVVKEVYENNNILWKTVTVSPASCAGLMSYDDPLNYPPDAFHVNAANGGVLHPTVTARCNAGDNYLILLGCTGTSPGTPVGPSLTLPLNIDACTRVFYGGIGSPLLTGFFGTLDASGIGRAQLTIPKNLVGVVNGHFAAVVISSSTGNFNNVTTPVAFTFR